MKKSRKYRPVLSKNRSWKICTIMRLTLFMSIFFVFTSYGGVLSQQRVNMNLGETTIKEALTEFQRLTHKIVIYSDDNFEAARKVMANFKDVDVELFLNTLLKGSGMTYKLMEDYILILPSKLTAADSLGKLKRYTIKGIVKDSKGDVIPGVTVLIKGTTVGVATGIDGKFELTTTDSSKLVLVFSFVGMQTVEVKYSGQAAINVTMKEEVGELEDVVVTGYANVKKSSFTGNSIQVSKDELMRVSSRNVIDALQVFDPSLRMIKNNIMGSDPNTLPEFYVRGQSGIGVMELDKDLSQTSLQNNPNAPIFIMDGFEVSIEKVYDFDVNRIASMTILKDAAATAIYGSRAANGVIVIETIAPEAGKLKVAYNFTATVTAPDLSDYNLMNAREKLAAETAAGFFTPGENASSADRNALERERLLKQSRVDRGVNTYWLSKPLQTEFNHKHSLYIDGGSQDVRVGIDLRYDAQGGVMKGSSRDKIGAGFYVDYRMKKLQIKNYVTYNEVKATASPYGNFADYANKLPYDLYKDENGNYVRTLQQEYGNGWHGSPGDLKNPLYEAKVLSNYSQNGYYEFADELSLNWYILDNLQLKGQFKAMQYVSDSEDFIDPLSGKYAVNTALPGELTLSEEKRTQFSSNLFMNYVASINKHQINGSLGLNTLENIAKGSTDYYKGFPSGHLNSPEYAAEHAKKSTFTDNHTRLFGAFFSVNYTYNDVYLFDASCRLDGSSEFGADKKYAPFWSSGVGMNIHNYEWMKKYPVLSKLKIRGTYGSTGKTNFPSYAAKNSYDLMEDWYETGSGVILRYYGNKNLTWEKTNTVDLGIDLGFLNDAYTLTFSWYNKMTKDLITSVTVPTSTGFASYMDNMGEVRNRGFELDLRAELVKRKDWLIVFWGNMAHNKNRIMKISDALKAYNERVNEEFAKYEQQGLANQQNEKYAKPVLQYVEGGSMTSIFGMRSLGINPADGEEIFMRANGSISYTWQSQDQQIIGNTEPKAQGAFGINAQYKNFSLFASLMYEFGGDEYNQTLVTKVESVDLKNKNADRRVLTDRWQKPGDKTKYKKIQANNVMTRPTSRFVQKYNNLKFNSLTVSYDFDRALVQRIGLSTMRAQFSMKDVFNVSSVEQERGLSYPFARTFDFSLNISF